MTFHNLSVAAMAALITGSAASAGGAGFAGCVENQATFTNDYWDLDTSGTSMGCISGNCAGVTGLADAQLKSGLPAGFDPTVWAQSPTINNSYPYLIANPPPQ